MSKPIVAVVGRPNVGKSTLFNSLCGQQISIVKDTPGVTRDRIYAEVSWLNHNFTLIDTGGIEPDTGDIILSQMREQAEIAIETADVIIFMTDVKQGLVDSDSKVADMLRRSHKPVILVVNKVDSFEKMMPDVYEFYNLGIGEPFPISAVNKLGFGEVLDEVVSHFPEGSDTDEEDDRPKVAIIGKPNVGKSSIINKLVGKNRVIVSDIAGTTRPTSCWRRCGPSTRPSIITIITSMTTMTATTSMSITIIMTTMTRTAMSTAATITMRMKSTSIITITTAMESATTPPAPATTITTTPTRCSPVGARRPPSSSPRRISTAF